MSSESRLEWSVVGGWRFVGGERMEVFLGRMVVRVWNFKVESDVSDSEDFTNG